MAIIKVDYGELTEGANYDYESLNVSPSGTNSVEIHDGMITIAPLSYESSQFEGCWYIKKGVLTKVYQNATPKATITYADDIFTVKNLTSEYTLRIWAYKEQS